MDTKMQKGDFVEVGDQPGIWYFKPRRFVEKSGIGFLVEETDNTIFFYTFARLLSNDETVRRIEMMTNQIKGVK